MKEFYLRTISGAVFVAVILSALWLNEYTLLILLIVILTGAVHEFMKLNGGSAGAKGVVLIMGLLILVLNFLVSKGMIMPRMLLLNVAIIPLTWTFLMFAQPETFTKNALTSAGALLYSALPLSLIPFICFIHRDYDFRLMFGLLILLWTYDSFAYITGMLFGRHRILPAISPKKSWEGFGGGLLFSILMACPVSLLYHNLSFTGWAGMALIVSITGTAGDFVESAMKRNAGVKDSGKFLPGHGGVLDRFDSILFSVPFVYLYLTLITF